MKPHVLVLAVLCLALLLSGIAGADAIPFSYSGPGLSVTGVLLGSNNSNGSWTITGIDASYNHIEVAAIVPLNTNPFFLYNNAFYGDSPNFDYLGLLFEVPGVGQVNLCSYIPGGGCGSGGYASILWDGKGYEYTQVSEAKFGPVVPEPATLVLLGGGLLATGVALRRRAAG